MMVVIADEWAAASLPFLRKLARAHVQMLSSCYQRAGRSCKELKLLLSTVARKKRKDSVGGTAADQHRLSAGQKRHGILQDGAHILT